MQRNLVLVNNLFKSKGNVANCVTDRAFVHTGNALEQFLHRNSLNINCCSHCTGATFETEQIPVRYIVNIVYVVQLGTAHTQATTFQCVDCKEKINSNRVFDRSDRLSLQLNRP